MLSRLRHVKWPLAAGRRPRALKRIALEALVLPSAQLAMPRRLSGVVVQEERKTGRDFVLARSIGMPTSSARGLLQLPVDHHDEDETEHEHDCEHEHEHEHARIVADPWSVI
jgi:ribosomal protein L13E